MGFVLHLLLPLSLSLTPRPSLFPFRSTIRKDFSRNESSFYRNKRRWLAASIFFLPSISPASATLRLSQTRREPVGDSTILNGSRGCKSAGKSHIPRRTCRTEARSSVHPATAYNHRIDNSRGKALLVLGVSVAGENLQTGDLRHIAGDWLLDYWSYRQLMRWLPI